MRAGMHPPEGFAESVSRETLDRLRIYISLLTRWSARINLVSQGDLEHVWTRHIRDSLQWLPYLRQAARAVDLGSGAGFPGLILAMAGRARFMLIESDKRKAAFLREAVRETGIDAEVHACRAQEAAVAPADVVTARALAPLDRLLPMAEPFLAPGGWCLFPKGRNVGAELTAACRQWDMDVEMAGSDVDPDSRLLIVHRMRRTIDRV